MFEFPARSETCRLVDLSRETVARVLVVVVVGHVAEDVRGVGNQQPLRRLPEKELPARQAVRTGKRKTWKISAQRSSAFVSSRQEDDLCSSSEQAAIWCALLASF